MAANAGRARAEGEANRYRDAIDDASRIRPRDSARFRSEPIVNDKLVCLYSVFINYYYRHLLGLF